MQKFKRNYIENAGLHPDEVVCEICGTPSWEIHHIIPRGMGGSKLRDGAENLIALCRIHHEHAEGRRQPKLTKEELYSYQKYVKH